MSGLDDKLEKLKPTGAAACCVGCGRPSAVTAVEDDRATKASCAEHAPPDLKGFGEAIASGTLGHSIAWHLAIRSRGKVSPALSRKRSTKCSIAPNESMASKSARQSRRAVDAIGANGKQLVIR